MQTERLTLRNLTADDAPRVAELAGDWHVARMTARLPYPYSRADATAWIAELGQASDEVVFAIVHEGQLIGCFGYVVKDRRTAEIGYWIGRPFWGHGFATEAGRALVDHCFRCAGFTRLTCCHFVDNPASGRVIEKLGFRLVGPCSGYSEARAEEAPTLTYERRRSWSAYIASQGMPA